MRLIIASQISAGDEETSAIKRVYELIADSHDVKVKYFHADNGRYAEKAFTDEFTECRQTITFCGVGAHHQKGLAENHIGRLTRGPSTNLLHAQICWREVIGEILWSFAWKDYERSYNDLQLDKDGLSPLHKFSSVYEPFRIRDYHTLTVLPKFYMRKYRLLVPNYQSGSHFFVLVFIWGVHRVVLVMLH